MSQNWRDDEIRELLAVRADAGIIRQIQGTARDSVVYDQITKRLHERGVFRAKAQVNNKLKALKRQYHQLVEQSGNDRQTWCYFSLCEAIWGTGRSANPVALVGSMETDSTSRSPEAAPYSDTEEKPRVYETDVSIDNSESSRHSPRKKRKRSRNHTQIESFSAEMSDLIAEMENEEKPVRPSPSRSSCTLDQKKRSNIDDAILTRLAHLDEERQKYRQQDNEDFRFAAVIVDMLANINPKHKSDVKFKIYQLLYEAGRDFPNKS